MTARAAEQPGLNAKDMKIVQAVIRNPRASVEEISKDTSVPRPTVQRRLGHLFDQGFLERSIHVVDWSAMFPLRYWVEVKVNVRQLQLGRGGRVGERRRVGSQKALASYIMDTFSRRYEGRLLIEDVTILLGSPTDLAISLRATDHDTVLEFVTGGLRNLAGVEATMTYHAAWSCSDRRIQAAQTKSLVRTPVSR